MKCYFIEKPFYTFKPFLMDHSQSFDPLTHKHSLCLHYYFYTWWVSVQISSSKSPVQLENILFYNSLTSLSPLQTHRIFWERSLNVLKWNHAAQVSWHFKPETRDPCRLSTAPQKQTDRLTESPCVRSVSEAVSRTSRAVMTLMAGERHWKSCS